MEGVEYYKGRAHSTAKCHEYGIYSIKQRELSKLPNGNSLQSTPRGLIELKLFEYLEKIIILILNFPLAENTNGNQTTKLRDRVQNISQKVDNIKLNDSNGTSRTLPMVTHRDHDENKNKTATLGVCTRRKLAADIDNNNETSYDKASGSQTQGDTLNQIKAMRRRHTRMATNVSAVSGM